MGITWSVLTPDVVAVDGEPVALSNPSRRLLFVLLVDANRLVATDRMADALWGENLPKTARNSVSRFVTDLRKALGAFAERIETAAGGYRVVVLDGELDEQRAERALDDTSRALASGDLPNRATVERLRAAQHTAADRPNPIVDEVHGYEAVGRLHVELRVGLTEALGEVLLRQGAYGRLITLMEQAVDQHPYHESFWYQLMQALERAGRPGDALDAIGRLRALLDEIGVAPVDRVLEFEADLRRGRTEASTPASAGSSSPLPPGGGSNAGAANRPVPVAAASPRPHDIVDPGTSLVGRIDDLRELHELMQQERLVSIVGLGGTGKTRVALGVSRALVGDHTTVHQVGLRSVADPSVVVQVIASVLSVPEIKNADPVALAKTVARHDFVLIIDNCEHLRTICGEVVRALLDHAPKVRVLVTAREALDVDDEAVYFLEPLPLHASAPSGRAPAMDLFVERARDHLPKDFDEHTVASICRLLSGLPLAIEIASAQLAYMTPAQLLGRIREARSGAVDVDEPAVSAMTEVLDWTWSTLSPGQQALFARLSVFESGWTLAAAKAVRAGPGSIEADLERLVTSCLVTRTGYRDSDRYEILVPVREFAVERLADRGETAVMRDRLVSWVQDRVGTATYAQHNSWSHSSASLRPEHGNILAALRHLDDCGRTEELVLLISNASGMMFNSGLSDEVIRWLEPYVHDTALPDRTRSAALAAYTGALHTVGVFEGLSGLAVEGIELAAGEPHDWIPIMAGYLAIWSLVAPVSIPTDELSTIALRAAQRGPTKRTNLTIVAAYRAHIALISRDYERSLGLFRNARRLAEHPGRLLMIIEIGETLSLYLLGRHQEARQSIDTWKSRTDSDHWHYILDVIRAIVVGGTGDPDQATADLASAVRSLPEAKAWGRAGIVQTAFAMLADFRGEHDLATELFASAVNRDVMLLTVAIEHVMAVRGVSGDQAWLEVGAEFWNRIVPEGSAAAAAQSTPQLLSWWTSGERPPATH